MLPVWPIPVHGLTRQIWRRNQRWRMFDRNFRSEQSMISIYHWFVPYALLSIYYFLCGTLTYYHILWIVEKHLWLSITIHVHKGVEQWCEYLQATDVLIPTIPIIWFCLKHTAGDCWGRAGRVLRKTFIEQSKLTASHSHPTIHDCFKYAALSQIQSSLKI